MVTTTVSSISKSGTPDYSLPQAWEDDGPVDLVAVDQIWRGEIDKVTDNFSFGAGVLGIQLEGSTTDPTRYKHLTAKDGVSFVDHATPTLRFNTAKGCSIQTTDSTALRIAEDFSRVTNLQFKTTTSLNQVHIESASDGVLLDSLILETDNAHGLFVGTNTRVVNSLLLNRTGGQTSFITTNNTSGSTDFINCLFVVPSDLTAHTRTLFITGAAATTFKNCGFFGSASIAVFFGGGTATFTTCFGDGVTPPSGYTAKTFIEAAFVTDVDTTSDFRLDTGSDLVDVGTTDTDAALDIFGTARPVGLSYDVGVHEFVIGGGGAGSGSRMLVGVGV